jgi:hypothetical protein
MPGSSSSNQDVAMTTPSASPTSPTDGTANIKTASSAGIPFGSKGYRPLFGRSFSVVQDLSRDEQWLLYLYARKLKDAVETLGSPMVVGVGGGGTARETVEDVVKRTEARAIIDMFQLGTNTRGDSSRVDESNIVIQLSERGVVYDPTSSNPAFSCQDFAAGDLKNVYLIFMENSTRTKESFRGASCFHKLNVNVFDCMLKLKRDRDSDSCACNSNCMLLN